jgi:hypothetical protein
MKALKLTIYVLLQALGLYCIATSDAASLNDYEYQKFTTDSEGNPAIRIVLPDGGGATASTNWTQTGTLVYDTRNNIGIGTTSPTSKLDVVGDVEVSKSLTTYDAYVTSMTAGYVPYITTLKKAADSGVYYTGTNVGIGTTVPTSKLEVTGSLEVSQNITASDIIYTAGLAITGADDTFTITGTAADFKVEIEGDLFVAEGLTVEGSNSTITFNGGVVNGVPQKVEEWSQVFVHNGTDAQLSFSLSESVTSANVKFDDDVEVGTDFTVKGDAYVSEVVSGTGVLYAIVCDDNGKLYKSSTPWQN